MSATDLAKLTTTYSANATSTPAVVFNGAASFPSRSGFPSSRPAPFDIRFPIVWVSPGDAKAILADFKFFGGALANSQPWTMPLSYHLDSWHYGATGQAWGDPLGSAFAGGCRDSGSRSPLTAVFQTTARAHGPTHPTTRFQNTHQLVSSASHVGASVAVAEVLSPFGVRAGVTFPAVACQKLYVDASKPMLLVFTKSNALGQTPPNQWGLKEGLFPYSAANVGIKIYSQAAWVDSGAGTLELTSGHATELPFIPFWTTFSQVPRRRVFDFPGMGTIVSGLNFDNPIIRYN